jgi:glycosyltransferase involved in cell wall biosynthesis
MNLIYYYPMKKGSPSNVARNIFDMLYTEQQRLPFEEIIICTDSKSKEVLSEKFGNIRIFNINEIYRVNREDIIHIPVSPFIFPNAKFLLQVYAKIRNNKIIVNYHGDLRNEVKLKYKFERKLDLTSLPTYLFIPSLLASTDKVVVNSHLLEDLIAKNYGVKSIRVIPNAVENYWFSGDEALLSEDENIYYIFYHGRLSPEKGVDLLIKGFHAFLHGKNYPNNIILYIAGEGSQREYLQSLAQTLNIDEKIVFLGNLDKKIIREYLKRVNCAIYPSIWDNFPLSIMEALAAANCPVFFSKRAAGISDFITDKDVLKVFNPGIKSIAEIFDYIFKNSADKNLVENQKSFAQRFTWNTVINYYIELYNNISQADVNKKY